MTIGDKNWQSGSGSGSGEANTASNLGATGEGLYASKVDVDLRFKKLKAGTNVTLSSDSESVTVNASGSSSAAYEAWLQAGNLGQPNSTSGFMYKTPRVGVNNQTDGWAQPLTSGSDDYNNGNVDPFLIPETGKLTEIRIWFSAAAVGTGTVGTPVIRISFYKVNSNGVGRTSLGDRDIPVSATGVGTWNNLGSPSPQSVLYNMSDISVTAGDLVGWQFTNILSSNDGINAISRPQTSVHFIADA